MDQENISAGYYYYAAADRYIIDTKHYIDRFYDKERFNQLAGTEDLRLAILKTIRAGIDQILTRYGDRRGSYLIHSKSRRTSAIISWSPPDYNFPYKNYRTRNNANVVTILPLKSNPTANKAGDVIITVASYGGDYIVIKRGSDVLTDMIMIDID
jgi:hypothetical protein